VSGSAAVGATAAAGLAIMVKASTEFGAKMAQLQSLSHASAGEMRQFHDAAMTTGEAFGYSATQVADAEIELTKAGIGIKEQLGGALPGALALAAAGQMDVADATSIAVTAMTQFGLTGGQIPHVADLLAAGADKALGSVSDLGMALKQGGLVASQFGLSVDDTVGTLSAFANAGLIGSDAGTSFKTMLTQLAAPSQAPPLCWRSTTSTLNDSKGNFIGITGLAGQLQTKLGGLTQAQRNSALATIFGTDAVRAANVLYKEGASGIQGWINKVDDTGFASAQAAGKMNSLQGDVQKLSAAFQTDLIKAGESADGALRGIVQSVTGVVKAFGALPQPVQGGVVAITAVVAAVGLIGGAVLLAIPKIVAFRAALTELRASGVNVGRVFGRGGALLAGLAAVAAGFASLAHAGHRVGAAGVPRRPRDHGGPGLGVDKLFGTSGTGDPRRRRPEGIAPRPRPGAARAGREVPRRDAVGHHAPLRRVQGERGQRSTRWGSSSRASRSRTTARAAASFSRSCRASISARRDQEPPRRHARLPGRARRDRGQEPHRGDGHEPPQPRAGEGPRLREGDRDRAP
jgi:TP901 family phage tail tape measure protein